MLAQYISCDLLLNRKIAAVCALLRVAIKAGEKYLGIRDQNISINFRTGLCFSALVPHSEYIVPKPSTEESRRYAPKRIGIKGKMIVRKYCVSSSQLRIFSI